MDIVHFAQLLKSYPKMKEAIDEKTAHIQELIGVKYGGISIPTSNMDGQPGGSEISDPTYNEVMKLCKIHDEEILRHCRELTSIIYHKQSIEWMMAKLLYEDPTEHTIITHLYFKRSGWRETARRAQYSPRGCQKYHKMGLERALKLWNT